MRMLPTLLGKGTGGASLTPSWFEKSPSVLLIRTHFLVFLAQTAQWLNVTCFDMLFNPDFAFENWQVFVSCCAQTS